MPQVDQLSRALLVLILLCLVVLILRGETARQAPPTEAPPAVSSQVERFNVRMVKLIRGAPIVLRTDTATGEAWRMGLLASGAWEALREGPDGTPSAGADEPGRYSINAVAQSRGSFTLVRTDHHTGRIWRKGLKNSGAWVAVPNPGEADAKATAPAADPADPVDDGDDAARDEAGE
jgi:hypothetical protein